MLRPYWNIWSKAMPAADTDQSNGCAERVKALMDASSMSLRDLADKSGVHYDALAKLMQGKVRQPRGINRIAKALGTTRGYLAFGEP